MRFPKAALAQRHRSTLLRRFASADKVVSTDPPYFDNIIYADLSDFFYVWLRRVLRPVFPDLFATLAVPKAEELVASPTGTAARRRLRLLPRWHDAGDASPRRPGAPGLSGHHLLRLQAVRERQANGTASTGWETFLDAVIRAGFAISGTWPMRTEVDNRRRHTNALASSIVLVCRPRAANAPTVTRRDFITALKAELPAALAHLQRSNIAPVDLAQAAIGPGMAVYTRYARYSTHQGNRSRSARRSHSSTRRSTRCSPSRKATSTLIVAGRWRGSSTGLRRG